MHWFTEEPFWLILMFFLVAICTGVAAMARGGKWFAVASVLAIVSATTVYAIERAIVTDREMIRDSIIDLARQVATNNVEGAASHFHPDYDVTVRRVRLEMPNYIFKTCNVTAIKPIEFEDSENPTKAEVEVRVFVNVDATNSQFRAEGMAPRAIVLSYQKTAVGDWKIIDYRHFDPRHRNALDARDPGRRFP